jgi:(p)ppGpp synthase/HD superfamily hydrolase
MATLERAIQIAAHAHAGQFDKAGQPYILHPIRVMLRMTTEEERITAILHDVVEDSTCTLTELAAEGFSRHIVEALDALTKQAGETRIFAAHRAARNRLARNVKLADNAENMDLSRIACPSANDFARIKEYEDVRSILLAAATGD